MPLLCTGQHLYRESISKNAVTACLSLLKTFQGILGVNFVYNENHIQDNLGIVCYALKLRSTDGVSEATLLGVGC